MTAEDHASAPMSFNPPCQQGDLVTFALSQAIWTTVIEAQRAFLPPMLIVRMYFLIILC